MIQDIAPKQLINHFENHSPDENSLFCIFSDRKLLLKCDPEKEEIIYPSPKEIGMPHKCIYLFAIDEQKYFLIDEEVPAPEGFAYCSMMELRKKNPHTNENVYAAYTAYHLWHWYSTNRYCGMCGKKTYYDTKERALKCSCGNTIYPRINPAVIVGVKNGNKLLLTKYNRGFNFYALIAGFTEIGETMEETVKREVKEEAGINVKNITYYKSQPWGIAQDILMGFYCEVDGDDTITVDHSELKTAEWIERENITLQPSDYSLTNEMMQAFKEGKIQ